jgi:hypothetical protein
MKKEKGRTRVPVQEWPMLLLKRKFKNMGNN